jgi:amino acid permease
MIIHSVLATMNPMLYNGYRLMLAMAAEIKTAAVANHASF